MIYDVLENGQSRRLVWGADASGRFRGREYFHDLRSEDQAKFRPQFERLAAHGRITNTEKFRKESSNIAAIKIRKHRLLCFDDGRDLVIIHGFVKKTTSGKREAREVKTAEALRTSYFERKRA